MFIVAFLVRFLGIPNRYSRLVCQIFATESEILVIRGVEASRKSYVISYAGTIERLFGYKFEFENNASSLVALA